MAGILHSYVLSALLTLHPFFVSVTEVKQNTKDKSLEISCKLFIDDLEKALAAHYKTPVDLSAAQKKDQNDKWIAGYFKQHFQVTINGQAYTAEYVGYEKESEAAWCYLQVNNAPASIKKLEISDNLLYEQFESQINIIHATVNGERKSTKIANPVAKAVFEYQ
ncbi:hypothetical protein SAMN05421788_10879 [Filimonas lacunae]|uniref:Uncharacterized protein n=1 Tax=Filimonas lacunae TaxID=477680 RepID=A0A173MEB5_9BACT|nr:DUF6702 family protein [Filimonas lacunae]BAV05778.1 hypothetical protein FLA_1790 [Filimonas lacunae]SIT28652.1 hypothetical protein SAMN05421788_10879 [Filimonas lacunae]